MSSPAKAIVLRVLLPNDVSAKTELGLGPLSKAESRDVTLASGHLTTEAMVGRIKELSKLRDEIFQIMRQLNLTRESGLSSADQPNYDSEMESARREVEETRNEYQELQGSFDKIQREIDDLRKRIAALTEISQTGFATDQLESEAGDFRRILGKLPFKKLEPAQKAITSQFKDQAILATGNRKQDALYVLVATPRDKSSQALQTLLLYDFAPIEISHYESRDVTSEAQSLEKRSVVLTKELDELKLKLGDMRKKAGSTFNQRLDQVVDDLMLLRGILKLGEGTQASQIYVHLERVPPAETVSNLSRKGIIELESSS